MNTDEAKTIEKVTLFLPLSSWSEILMTLDKKIQMIAQLYGFGEVTATFNIVKGRLIEVAFHDKVRLRWTPDGLTTHSDAFQNSVEIVKPLDRK